MARSSECTEQYAQKVLDTADIVRDLPKDIADRLPAGHKEKWGSMELTLNARRNSALPLKPELMKFFASKEKKIGEFYELKDMPFEAQEIKVDVKIGRQKRRISLGHMSSSPLYDVTDEVEIAKDGNATYESINEGAEQLAEGLREGVYGEAIYRGSHRDAGF